MAHAVAEFALRNKIKFDEWNKNGMGSLVVVTAKNEEQLFQFKAKLEKENLNYYGFYEPDIGYGLTALAVEPSEKVKKLCSCFPLAGKQPKETINLKTVFQTVENMMKKEQTNGVSILEHGLQVCDKLFNLILPALKTEETEIKLPDWFKQNKSFILENIPSEYVLRKYTIFHDIGKPYCLERDEEGRKHFPNHAEYSFQKYLELFPNEKNIAELIRNDMIVHTIKDHGVLNFSKNKNCVTHLVVGLAEIYANAEMFGGIESNSFKIKYKQLDRRGQAIISVLKQKR